MYALHSFAAEECPNILGVQAVESNKNNNN